MKDPVIDTPLGPKRSSTIVKALKLYDAEKKAIETLHQIMTTLESEKEYSGSKISFAYFLAQEAIDEYERKIA